MADINVVTRDEAIEHVEDVERRWQQHQRERRLLSNERIRATNDAIDAGASWLQVTEAIRRAGNSTFQRHHVANLLACGYPEDEVSTSA